HDNNSLVGHADKRPSISRKSCAVNLVPLTLVRYEHFTSFRVVYQRRRRHEASVRRDGDTKARCCYRGINNSGSVTTKIVTNQLARLICRNKPATIRRKCNRGYSGLMSTEYCFLAPTYSVPKNDGMVRAGGR